MQIQTLPLIAMVLVLADAKAQPRWHHGQRVLKRRGTLRVCPPTPRVPNPAYHSAPGSLTGAPGRRLAAAW